jgi:hypothetical protein
MLLKEEEYPPHLWCCSVTVEVYGFCCWGKNTGPYEGYLGINAKSPAV